MPAGSIHHVIPKGSLLAALGVAFSAAFIFQFTANNAPFANHPSTLTADWAKASAVQVQCLRLVRYDKQHT